MKTLFIARHSHAAGGSTQITDFQRPLTPHGEEEARATANHLGELQPSPTLILSSSAQRAQATARILHVAAPDAHLCLDDSLYGADPATWIQQLQDLDDAIQAVLLVGHNPGLEHLVQELTGTRGGFLPSTLAHLQLLIDSWHEVAAEGSGQVIQVWSPGH